MSKRTKRVMVSLFAILVTFAFLPTTYGASSLSITVTTSQESYNLGGDIFVTGKLLNDSEAVPDGLVAIQVNDPENKLFVVRTQPTGTSLTGHWSVEILEVTTTDSAGNPKYSFPKGGEIGFKVIMKNNDLTSHDYTVILNPHYSDGTPFMAFTLTGSIGGNQTKTTTVWPLLIPADATTGSATVYANAFNQLPKDGGFAYCPEKSATFTITGGTTTQATQPASEEGAFDITFRTWGYGGTLGTYMVYVNSLYEMWPVTNTTTFEVILLGDIDGDGFVTIADVSVTAIAFGSYPGHPRWNPIADLDGDGMISISDVSAVAINFGKWGVVVP